MALKPTNLTKYLERYAEPEAALPAPLGKRYEFAVVVPVCGERREFTEGWRPMTEHLPPTSRVLFVLVVNSDAATSAEYSRANDELLSDLRSTVSPSWGAEAVWLVEGATHDVLVIDRHTPSRQLPLKCGVGLARKVGSDIVGAWIASGAIASSWWLSTDADVILPADLSVMWRTLPSSPGVLCLPFEHVAGSEREVDVATWAIELDLRYHVLGLAYAGSTYAWPALGSCLAIHADTYASVRGFPKRLAGEDFYLLEKASKLGGVGRYDVLKGASTGGTLERAPIRIVARRSARTPFGTGQSVNQLLLAGDPERVFRLRNPACYQWLKALLHEVRVSVEHGGVAHFQRWLGETADRAPEVARAVTDTGIMREIDGLCASLENARVRTSRVNEWFGGLRQVQFLKALEPAFESLPYREALANAPFVGELGASPTIQDALVHLRAASWR